MAENNPPQKKTPIDYISDSDSSDEELNQPLDTSQEEFMTLLRDQLKPLKQHYHTLWLNVILQLKEDLTEN